jgi:hypothetical protein
MDNLYNQKVIDANQVFDTRFMETKALFLCHFNTLPNVNFINRIDGEKAFAAFNEQFGSFILQVHTYRWYKHERKKFQFDRTVIILNNGYLVEFDTDYCEILHNGNQDEFVAEVTALLIKYKERQKRQPSEINLIVRDASGLELKTMEIKKQKLDCNLFYEDDFKEVDDLIQKRLKQKNDKGIVLLHGLPGTGKTTYLRYLIGKIKKRVLFLSPNVAGNLMNPDFIDLLIDNPNTILIIEDAENIIMDRNISNDPSVSNLLNISDGLLADFLNVQLICTFNSSLTMVDSALMRKGRLIAKYEFRKLSIPKSQKLSDYFGFKNVITRPMTVAEISNQHEKGFETRQVQVFGFRRESIIVEN